MERMFMRKKIAFWTACAVFSFVIWLSAALTVKGQSNAADPAERFFREKEEALLADTRKLLDAMGYADSGVTLRRTVWENGDREYVFTVHNRRIDALSGDERQSLSGKLCILTGSFADPQESGRCRFRYEYLTCGE